MPSNPNANIKPNDERMMLCPKTGPSKGCPFITLIQQHTESSKWYNRAIHISRAHNGNRIKYTSLFG